MIVDGEVLTPDELLRERLPVNTDWVVAADGELSIELDTTLDDDLRLEGRLYDQIHEVNVLRKETGLEITDRIKLWIPDQDLLATYADRLAAETLAVSVDQGELRIEKT